MKTGNALMRLIRKDYLIFKKERSEASNKLEESLSNTLDAESYNYIEPDVMQASYIKARYHGVLSRMHPNHDKKKKLEFRNTDNLEIENWLGFDGDGWLYVVPAEWEICGGFIVEPSAFFKNIWGLSYLIEDDFDVLEDSLNNMLTFRGERRAENLIECSVVVRGDFFLK